ncbi:MAG: hypothetical protein O2897_01150 [bacterium]|nr:hypothetical protein [bacterium]
MSKYLFYVVAMLISSSQVCYSQATDSKSKTTDESSPAETFIGYLQTMMIVGGGVGLTGYAKRGALKEFFKRYFPNANIVASKNKAPTKPSVNQLASEEEENDIADDWADQLPRPVVQSQPLSLGLFPHGASQSSLGMMRGSDPCNELRRRAAASGIAEVVLDIGKTSGEIEVALKEQNKKSVLMLAKNITMQNIHLFDRGLLRELREFLSCHRSKAANLIIEKISKHLQSPRVLESIV